MIPRTCDQDYSPHDIQKTGEGEEKKGEEREGGERGEGREGGSTSQPRDLHPSSMTCLPKQ